MSNISWSYHSDFDTQPVLSKKFFKKMKERTYASGDLEDSLEDENLDLEMLWNDLVILTVVAERMGIYWEDFPEFYERIDWSYNLYYTPTEW